MGQQLSERELRGARVRAAIEVIARTQHGVISWGQLLDAGANEFWIDRREREGYLARVAPGVYRVWGVTMGFEGRAMAAVLSARGTAVVSHRSAAFLHGLEPVHKREPSVVDITVPRHRRPKRRPGLTFYESSAYDLVEVVLRREIPVTGVARTILDCCRYFADPIRLLDDALRQRLVTWDELWQCYFAHRVRGRRGLNAFREILIERDGNTPPAGEFARRMTRVLTDAGLPEPVFEHPVTIDGHDYYLDLAWPDRVAAVECNDDGSHITPKAFRRDPAKRNRCELAGWTYLEFTWWDLVHDPAGVIAQVSKALQRRPALLPSLA